MRQVVTVMGMLATVEVGDPRASARELEDVFAGLIAADAQFSPFKQDSELSQFNRGEIGPEEFSLEMREVLEFCERTRQQTNGYFDIRHSSNRMDLCGLVKGWAINRAAQQISRMGFGDYYVEISGDIQCHGRNCGGAPWRVGIRNPFAFDQIVKIVHLSDRGIATSGNYIQKSHIYNPHALSDPLDQVVSLTVIAPDILEADRFATAAYAMGRAGLEFVESMPGLEGYEIDATGMARMTSGFPQYLIPTV